MADSQTQEKVREAVASLQNVVADYDREFAAFGGRSWFRAGEVDCNPAHLRTLLAAYTTAEADMAEARKLMEPFVKLQVSQLHGTPHVLIDGERRSMSLTMQEHLRALAAFYNKGEE